MPKKLSSYRSYGQKLISLFARLLFSRQSHSLTELSQMLGCSKQTVIRLIQDIKMAYGVEIEEYIEDRRFMQQAPNFNHDLTIVAVAPNGDYASFCGIWYVPDNRITYVEPVATDPDYRRMGLGTAVVVEGMRRTIPLGSQVAWVGSDQKFYLSMGFQESYRDFTWIKHF